MTEQAQAKPLSPPVIAWRPYIALAIGVLAVSTAAIFIRLAQNESASSLVVAATRLVVASTILTPIVYSRHRQALREVAISDLKWTFVSGVVLSLHFATWISSLEYTAVINSVTLVNTVPLWVAFMSPLFLGERLGRWAIAGLLVAVTGGILVSLSGEAGDPPTRHDPWLGNGLALCGAVMAAIYFMIGRRLRARLGVILYIWLVYSVAAFVLLVAVTLSGQQVVGLPANAYLWMILIGLVPQLLGHSSFNYALGYFPAAFVSLVILAEPVGSGLLAIIFLGEWPVRLQMVGAGLILAGIAMSSREQQVERNESGD